MDPALALALWLALPLPAERPPAGSLPLRTLAAGNGPIRNQRFGGLAAQTQPVLNLAAAPPRAGSLPPLARAAGGWPMPGLVLASRAPRPRETPAPPPSRTPGRGAAEPPSPPALTAQQSGGSSDRSRRFPLRRESGGTRGACAARLLAQLVPPDGQLDPGREPILGLIEGDSPEPAP